jgi:hypothetical protein
MVYLGVSGQKKIISLYTESIVTRCREKNVPTLLCTHQNISVILTMRTTDQSEYSFLPKSKIYNVDFRA